MVVSLSSVHPALSRWPGFAVEGSSSISTCFRGNGWQLPAWWNHRRRPRGPSKHGSCDANSSSYIPNCTRNLASRSLVSRPPWLCIALPSETFSFYFTLCTDHCVSLFVSLSSCKQTTLSIFFVLFLPSEQTTLSNFFFCFDTVSRLPCLFFCFVSTLWADYPVSLFFFLYIMWADYPVYLFVLFPTCEQTTLSLFMFCFHFVGGPPHLSFAFTFAWWADHKVL